MRAWIIIAFVALAGCAEVENGAVVADDGEAEARDRGPDRALEAPEAERREVSLYQQAIQADPRGPFTTTIEVPENATLVKVRLESSATVSDAMRFELGGCGVYDVGQTYLIAPGGGGSYQGEMCMQAEAGEQPFVVDAGAGFTEGRLSVTALVPA